jgi:AcrR family transcriptional regulator
MFNDLGEDVRSRILRGAFSALAEHGTQQTSVENVLAASSVSRRTFYLHFHGMAGVMAALYTMAMEQMVKEVREAVKAEPNPVRKVVAAIDSYVEFQRLGGPAMIALQADAIRSDSSLTDTRVQTLSALVDIVDKGTQVSLGQTCDPLVYRSVLMGIEGMVIHLQRDGTFTEAESKRVRSIGISVLLAVLTGVADMPATDK